MSSTTASASTALTQRAEDLLKRIRKIPYLPLIIAVAASVAILMALLLWARSPDYKVLFSNLSDRDGSAIVTQLDQMKVPYRLMQGGTSVMIPADQVDQVRLNLAGQGLPKASGVGFELMDKQAFGISQFTEHVNYQRALEGELARSVETIDAVNSARVHLAIPTPSVFVRDRRKPSASIVVNLHSGRTLDKGQVDAITHLVSSSVSEMPNDGISIVDQRGNLLTQSSGADNIDDAQLKYTAQIERDYQKRLENILGAMMGNENVRTVVTAEVDFSRAEHTQERYDPNADPNQSAIRSQQSSEARQVGDVNKGGIPGSISNQPPGTAPSPINAPAPAQNGQAQAPQQPGNTRQDKTTNYEVNRTIRHVQEERGGLKRLSVAVVVNYRTVTPEVKEGEQPEGENASKQEALDEETLNRIKRVARETMGFSEARGDTLEVVNAPLTAPTPTDDQPSWWENPILWALLREYGRYAVIAFIAWMLWRKAVKPVYQRHRDKIEQQERLKALSEQESEDESEGEDDAFSKEVAQIKRQQHDARIRDVRERARQDPALIGMILKGWLHEDKK